MVGRRACPRPTLRPSVLSFAFSFDLVLLRDENQPIDPSELVDAGSFGNGLGPSGFERLFFGYRGHDVFQMVLMTHASSSAPTSPGTA